ncbi:hypothetical protein [Desulfosporosinus youngiae]|uniref:Uncharacterized protein n=1 Tax=Desulfosporosinus youngiae DSM 17734 TaxID=768710 RepID=H5Y243_9FIRM|nr:hypothetical protein [Desulfosporosinus youngiae]EHQ88241.1 hypothetical protein DesyoDRAFT_1070 [Desulfosporosinus youngiae DSM 17734]
MLQQLTRERIQALVHHPDFTGSVSIADKKIFHKDRNGAPAFYVDVNIHGGQNVLNTIAEALPDLTITDIRKYHVDHSDFYSFGDIADGVIESARVSIWAEYGEVQKEKDSAPTETHMEISQSNYITESEVIANARTINS